MAHALDFPTAAETPGDLHAAEAELGFDKERATMLHLLLPGVAATAFVWFGWFVERNNPLSWVAPLLLIAAVWAAYMLIGRKPQLATTVVVLALLAAIGWAHEVSGNQTIVLALVPTASAAMLLLGVRWGVLVAVLATALIWRIPADASSGTIRGVLVVVLWSSVWLSWITFRSTRVLMTWAWQYLSQFEAQIEALRDSRAELARTLNSLDHAYYRLQQANADLERARQAAEEARRFKAEFAANISHELRTPLNLVLGFSEMMIQAPDSYGEPLPLAYRSEIEAIARNARHLSSLVDDVLDLSGIEAQRMALLVEETALADVVDEAVSAVEMLYRHRGLYLRVELDPALPPLLLDPTRIRQVLINLLNNAVRFTEHGGVVARAAADAQGVTLTIADTGIGIPADKLVHVFDEFEQLGAATHRNYGGSGLGLAISKQFIELHGGRIWVESTPGLGSTFTIFLPRQPLDRLARPTATTSSWASAAARQSAYAPLVLVVDDDPWTARTLGRYLDGYRVLSVGNQADETPAALLINDHGNNANHVEVRQLIERFAGIPVFTCTLPTRHAQRWTIGADEYLPKPVSAEQLHGAIARLPKPVQTIIVIDDDPDVLQLLTRMLTAAPAGYRVQQAQGGTAGLTLIRATQPDLVILDLLMPEMDGYAVLTQIRQDATLCDLPVIVVSARGYEQEVIRARQLGVTQGDGFSVGTFVKWLRASLEALRA